MKRKPNARRRKRTRAPRATYTRNTTGRLQFTKMYASGEDFLVIDLVSQYYRIEAQQIQRLAHPQLGIVFGALLMVLPPATPDADFRFRLFTANGEEIGRAQEATHPAHLLEMLGAARCVAQFVRQRQLTNKHQLLIETPLGELTVQIGEFEEACIDFLPPAWANTFTKSQSFNLVTPSHSTPVTLIHTPAGETGTHSHALLMADNMDRKALQAIASALENHTLFPKQATIMFMQVENRKRVHLRFFRARTESTFLTEDAGAAGALEVGGRDTDAFIAAAVGLRQQLIDHPVQVLLHAPTPGFSAHTLGIHWQGDNQVMRLGGTATTVFEGSIAL
ncbi:Diaminopimelate epimerase [gamma proteobacterium HdN1]|nr:Diaminopimelate epimerase [gamma proteobacterium HdN1]